MGKNTAMSQEQALRIFQGCDQVQTKTSTKQVQTKQKQVQTKPNQVQTTQKLQPNRLKELSNKTQRSEKGKA